MKLVDYGLIKCILLLFLLAVGRIVSGAEGDVEQARDYVESLDDSCVRTDGYFCEPREEIDFLTPEGLDSLNPGTYFAAFQIAYADLEKDAEFSAGQKSLRHYKIGLTENPDHYIVLFSALLLPAIESGEPAGVLSLTYGRSVQYWVDKATMTISDKKFSR